MVSHSYHRTVVFVHPADGTADELANRLRALKTRNAIDDVQIAHWEDANRPPSRSGLAVPVDALLEDAARWADVHDALLPFTTSRRLFERLDTESLPPVLAEYWDGTLCYVAPHVDDEGVHTVEEYVASVERTTERHTHA